MVQSAGILLYKQTGQGLVFFLVHPGGPFFAKKDAGWWTVPKGEINEGEDPLAAAIREFAEETGTQLQGFFIQLTPITQKAGKVVHCWALEFDLDPAQVVSNNFDIEWPPKSGRYTSFPEIDKAGWFKLEDAKLLINGQQAAFLNELLTLI